jgi:uncharacterized membrane-anchored protein YitT (DUF2179 family)
MLKKKHLFELSQLLFAIFLASVGLKAFLLPNGFLDGGVTGIAILISELFSIEVALLLPLISIPFFVIGYFTVTKRILIKSFLAILILSVVIHYENFESMSDDPLIIATFGGIFLGIGIGLAIKNGAVLDGSEILGLFVHEKYGFSIGSIILCFNIILFSITAMVLSPEAAMYSILTYLITAKAIDFTLQGFENYVGLMIVSDKSDQLEEIFQNELGLGMTIYQGLKGYGKKGMQQNRQILHIIVTRIDINRINQAISRIDKDAFIIEFDVNQVKGGKIRRLLEKKVVA